MFNEIVRYSKLFQKLASLDEDTQEYSEEHFDQESSLEQNQDMFDDSVSGPTEEDKHLIVALVNRSIKFLSDKDLESFSESFLSMHSYLKGKNRDQDKAIEPTSLTPEFFGLVDDDSMLEWIHSLKDGSMSEFDNEMATEFVLKDLSVFDSMDKIFK